MNERIAADPEICGGEPCVRGTRVPVWVVLSHLAAGEDYNTVIKNFPNLKREDILACIDYASYLTTEKAVSL